jgi:hypothetical protein
MRSKPKLKKGSTVFDFRSEISPDKIMYFYGVNRAFYIL